MSWTRRLAVSTGLAVAAAGIAVPLSLGTASASASSDPLASVAAFTGSGSTAARTGKLPQQLKDDLKSAWNAPDGRRVAALQAVLAKAVAGDYGTAVQTRAKKLSTLLAAMDPTLKADLQKAIELPKAQRQAALKDIRQKVRDGGYGATVKQHGKLLRRLVRLHRLGR
ncbi:MAG: hypothetical protein QOD70_2555 [Frankiales bacterium]|jgi:hypothetical protein|nr:hypothetical protein [Frankiales bacterium]